MRRRVKDSAPAETKDVQVAIRLEPALDAQINEHARQMSNMTGLEVTRAAAIRHLLTLGLASAKKSQRDLLNIGLKIGIDTITKGAK